jgi:hypothetical protein
MITKYRIRKMFTLLLINDYLLVLVSISFVGYLSARIARYLSYLVPATFLIDIAIMLDYILGATLLEGAECVEC